MDATTLDLVALGLLGRLLNIVRGVFAEFLVTKAFVANTDQDVALHRPL